MQTWTIELRGYTVEVAAVWVDRQVRRAMVAVYTDGVYQWSAALGAGAGWAHYPAVGPMRVVAVDPFTCGVRIGWADGSETNTIG